MSDGPAPAPGAAPGGDDVGGPVVDAAVGDGVVVDPAGATEHVEPQRTDAAEALDDADDVGEADGDADQLEVTAESLVADLEAMVAERDEFLDAYRRAQADFENFRKQSQRRQDDAIQAAVTSLVNRLLPVLDAGDAARAHGGPEATAAEQIAGLLYDVLAKEGLEAVDPDPGAPFDPNVHEAVVHEPSDDGEPSVIEVLRTGYLWSGRVIRPTLVKVKG